MTQEEIDLILSTITPNIVEQEEVYGGHRPLVRSYAHENELLFETFTYANEANSDAWVAIKFITYTNGTI